MLELYHTTMVPTGELLSCWASPSVVISPTTEMVSASRPVVGEPFPAPVVNPANFLSNASGVRTSFHANSWAIWVANRQSHSHLVRLSSSDCTAADGVPALGTNVPLSV